MRVYDPMTKTLIELAPGMMNPNDPGATLDGLTRSWWQHKTGAQWAEANPADAKGVDGVWKHSYGIEKTKALKNLMAEVGKVPKKTSWLEVGCSEGGHLNCLRALGYSDVTGVDISYEPLENAGDIPVAQADSDALPFADLSFDVVTTSGTLMSVGDPEGHLARTVKEMARVTRKWMVIVEIWQENPMILVHHIHNRPYPPSVALPWERYLAAKLPDWEVKGGYIWPNLQNEKDGGKRLPICMVLVERKEAA